MTHRTSTPAAMSAELADDLASTAAYVRAQHGCAYGLTATDVSGTRIGAITLTIPVDHDACCVGCWAQSEALDLAVRVLGVLGWSVGDRHMATVVPPRYDPTDPDHVARVEEVEERLNRAASVPQPAELAAWLDDLARVSIRHGLVVRATRNGEVGVVRASDAWPGYSACIGGGEVVLRRESIGDVVSLDPRRITAHERLQILDGRLGPLPPRTDGGSTP